MWCWEGLVWFGIVWLGFEMCYVKLFPMVLARFKADQLLPPYYLSLNNLNYLYLDCEMGQWSVWSTYGKKVETISRKYGRRTFHESKEYRLEVRNRTIVSKSYNEYCDSLDTPREQHRKCRSFKEYYPDCKTERECKEFPWDCRPLECKKQLQNH